MQNNNESNYTIAVTLDYARLIKAISIYHCLVGGGFLKFEINSFLEFLEQLTGCARNIETRAYARKRIRRTVKPNRYTVAN